MSLKIGQCPVLSIWTDDKGLPNCKRKTETRMNETLRSKPLALMNRKMEEWARRGRTENSRSWRK